MGAGDSTLFIRLVEEAARENGALLLELRVLEGNERARVLYKKCGFVETGRLPNAIRQEDGSFDALISMVKTLV